MTRHLLITRRRIPLDQLDQYRELWHALRSAVSYGGGRAWLFVSMRSDDHFIEFMEWEAEPERDLSEQPPVASPLGALEASFPSEESDLWLEARL